MATVFLATGTNLGDRMHYLRQANQQINDKIGEIEACSSIYETAAWGGVTTLDFLNQVIQVKTRLQPLQVLEVCLNIEAQMGRKRATRWGARNIDIDVLFYDQQVINTPQLILPHPRLHQRNFVLLPLSEISPDWMHPILNKNITALIASCSDELPAKIIAKS